ncbi:MAG: hypothetical protein QOH21_3334 [Acidobacteriota bacterium]|nr:hypothetical protein [Acidobacteriota bacterium]
MSAADYAKRLECGAFPPLLYSHRQRPRHHQQPPTAPVAVQERRESAALQTCVLVLFLLGLATPVFAVTSAVASTPRGTVVAHDGLIELFGKNRILWRADGLDNPAAIVTGERRVAVLDTLANEAVVIDLASGKAQRRRLPESPTAGVFLGDRLFILARDARLLVTENGTIPLAADPAFLRATNDRIYVYSRITGIVEELDGTRVTRRVRLAPFASDFEIDGRNGCLVDPRAGKIHTFALATMQPSDAIDVGAVPVDLAFTGGGTAITARTLAIADPSAKRVWLIEGVQSMGQAVARGFLRGLLGLGLYGGRASQFPTGVDRVLVRGKTWAAYDSSSRTLYRFTKSTSTVIAKELDPEAFTVTDEAIVWWQNGRLRSSK